MGGNPFGGRAFYKHSIPRHFVLLISEYPIVPLDHKAKQTTKPNVINPKSRLFSFGPPGISDQLNGTIVNQVFLPAVENVKAKVSQNVMGI